MRRSMTLTGLFLAVLVCSVSGQYGGNKKDLTETLVSMEKQAWEAFNKKDTKFFVSFLADDFVAVGRSGTWTKAEEINRVSGHDCVHNSYSFNNTKVAMIDKNVALLTYEAMADSTCGGKRESAKLYLTSVFVKRKGQWLGVFHTAYHGERAAK
jgi:ketosteroid isomerase-like protein